MEHIKQLLSTIHCIHTLCNEDPQDKSGLEVLAWNMERGKRINELIERLEITDPDVILATELDVGMVRSGNINTIERLANALNMQARYVVEFIEYGHGNQTEMKEHASLLNQESWHCNAIFSRLPIRSATLLRFESSELWKGLDWHSDRDGSRCALFCELEWKNKPLVAVVSHFECLTCPQERQRCIQDILDHLKQQYPEKAVILGGDFNTAELPTELLYLNIPELIVEPMFQDLHLAGFTWNTSNTNKHTRRQLPNGFPKPPFKKVDWIFLRDICGCDAKTVPAVNSSKQALSDHEIVSVRVS